MSLVEAGDLASVVEKNEPVDAIPMTALLIVSEMKVKNLFAVALCSVRVDVRLDEDSYLS